MRPLRLELSGFTAFRDTQKIDFSGFDLFVITGPTGAGKTSLLDAITLSLYGQVPRMGKHGLGQLVSHGRPEARILLEFSVSAEQYRVSRRLPRKGAQQGRLERRDGERWVDAVERGGVKAVNQAILELVKLDFDSFCKAIVLPQGEFARFLKGEPGERRETLSALLGLRVYDRMGALARDRAKELRIKGEQTRTILAEQFADATAEGLQYAQGAVQHATEAARRAASVLNEATGLEEVREQALVEAQTAKSLSDRFASLARELENEVERCTAAEAVKAEADSQRSNALAAAEAAATAYARAETRRREVVERTGSREQLAQLLEAVTRRIMFEQRVDDAQRELAAATTVQRERAAALEQHSAEAERATAVTETAREAEATIRTEMERLTGERDRLQRRLDDAMKAAEALDAAHRNVATAEAADELASAAAERSGQEHTQAERARDNLRREHAVAALAAGLEPSDPCPVCARPLTEHPRIEPDVEWRLADAEKACASTRAAAESARRHASEAQGALAAARARQEDTEQAREVALGEQADIAALQAQTCQATNAANGALAALAQATATGEQAGAAAQQAALALTKAQAELAAASRERDLRREAFDQAASDRDSALALLRERFGREIPSDAAPQLEAARAELVAAEDDAEATRSALDAAHNALQAVERTRESASDSLAAIDLRLGELRTRTQTHAEEVDRITEAPALAALPEPAPGRHVRAATLAAWCATAAAAINASAEARHSAAAAAAAKLVSLASALDLPANDATTALTSVVAAERDATSARVRAEEAAARLAERVDQRHTLEAQLATDDKQISVLTVLATELRADHFIEFVVQETLDLLASHASHELLRISVDRYSLTSKAGEFSVIDHVNADERRSVKTLSGGETFMASLSLALALSKHVSELAGEGLGASLDAVFIDEGFGSLDPETLEEVIDALERLREDDLLVGVISHVPALAERVHAGLRVQKDGNRSIVMEAT